MRLRLPVFILALLCAAGSIARAETPKHEIIERDIAYVPDGDPAQKLDIYLPAKASDKPLPLVIYIHGGGWQGGSKAGCWPRFLIPDGYAAASVEYRFSQKAKFPAQIQDCQAAIRWLRAHSKKYNLDPDHFGVWGDSAGGHLVALLGTSGGTHAFPPIGGNDNESDRVQAVCDYYGPTNFNAVPGEFAADKSVKSVYDFSGANNPYAKLIGSKIGDDKEKGDAASPIHYVSKDSAPILILHGTKDPHVPYAQSVEFADALRKAGVDVTLQTIPGAGHGGAQFMKPEVLKLVKAFFDKNLKGADVKVEPLPASDFEPAAKPK